MRTPSGDLHVVDFKTSQIVSNIQPKDYWDDKRHWEIKNNIDTLEFRVFENTDYAATLVQQNLVLKEVRGGRIVPYVITEAEKDSNDRSLMVYASGEWIQLAKAGIIEPQKIESKTLKQCMEIALKGTKWEIGKTEHDGAHSFTVDEFIDPLSLLKKIAASFELEIQYRAEVVGSQIVARYVDMVKKRGRDTRKEVTLGKDLMGIKRIENSQNICTALLGYVKKENEEFITISEINNGVPYLVDDAAYQRWNEKGKHKFAFYTPQTEDQDMSPQRLMTLMKTEINKLVNTSVSYEVQAQSIGRVFGLAHELINEGDTIRIIDTGFIPKLYLEARAIAGDESFKDPTQDKYMFGDYREIVDQNDELRRLYQRILSSLGDKVPKELFDELSNRVDNTELTSDEAKKRAEKAEKESKVAKDLAEATADYLEKNTANVIEQPTAPITGLKDGKTIWIDNSNPNERVQKLWKNGQWVRITPDTQPLKDSIAKAQQDLTKAQQDLTKAKQDITTAQGDLTKAKQDIDATQQEITKAKQDIATTKTDLTNTKTQLQGEVNKANEEITALQTSVKDKVDATWVNKQIEGKADKSGVYTKEYINDNLVGKQVYETDKQGNVKKFTDMNTAIERNATAITSKAEQSSVNTLNDNLTGVTKRVTSVEQTATGLTTRITSAEGKINTATGDITSLQTKTNEIKNTVDMNKQEISSLTKKTDSLESKTNTIKQTADSNTQKITSVEQKTNVLDGNISDLAKKSNEIKQTVDSNTQTITKVEQNVTTVGGKVDTLTKTTNEIKQTVDTNTATIEKIEGSFVNANYLVTSSANNEYPEFADDKGGHITNRATGVFENNYYKLSSTDGLDSFYQIGSYKLNNLRGFTIGKDYTLSADLIGNAGYAHLVVFEHNGTGWSEAGQNPIKINPDTFTRGAFTFKLRPTAKAFMIRIRFPMSANSTGKYLCLKDVKLEDGSIPTKWTDSIVSNTDFTKTTNEIKQTVDENSQKITSIEDRGSVGTNLIYNSDFSQRDGGLPLGWNWGTPAKISYQAPWDDDKRAGVVFFDRQDLPAGSPAQIISGYSSRFPVTVGKEYTFSVYVFVSKGTMTTNKYAFILEFFNNSGTRVQYQDINITDSQITEMEKSGFIRISATVKATATGTVEGCMRLALFHNGRIAFRMPQVEQGKYATGWNLSANDFSTRKGLDDITVKTSEIKQTVDGHTQSITSVTQKANTLETKTNTIENTVNSNKQAITSVTDKAGVLEKKTSTIEQNVNSITQSLKSVTEKAGVLETKTNTIETTVNGHTQSISSITGKADTLEGKTGALETKTNTIEKTVDSNKQSITSVTQKANTLETKTNTLQQTMDSTTSQIKTISTTQGKHGDLITEQGTSITQLNNQIGSKVTEKQVQDYVGGLGNTNLIMNSAFEKREIHPTSGTITKRTPSFDKWLVPTGATVDVARHHDGYSSAKLEVTGQTNPTYYGINQVVPVVSRSGMYVYSAWIYTDAKATFEGQGGVIKMQLWNGSTALDTVQTELEPLLVNGSWVFVSVKLGMPNKDVTHIRGEIWVRKNGRLWVSQPQLQQGSNPSTFMENPKDMGNYDEMIGEIAKKVATSDYNQKVTSMETSINQHTKEISLKAVKTEVYTKIEGDGRYGSKAIVERHEAEIKTQADQINLRVQKGDIASTINQTAQSVLIQAAKINLRGAVTADSIDSGILRGTQIYTNADTSGNYLKLEKQNLTLMKSTQARGYFGFIDRTDAGIQSALVLGNDYTVNKTLEGSLVLDHVVEGNAWTKAQASIGIASGGKTGNEINMSSYIKFQRYMNAMFIRSKGPIEMTTEDGDIRIYAKGSSNGQGLMRFESNIGTDFKSKSGTWTYRNSDKQLADTWSMKVLDDPNGYGDVDINMGNQITLRVPRMYPYTQEGLQIKNNKGNDYASISCATVIYSSLSQRSTRQLKTAIKDIGAIDPLAKLMELTPRQYYMKADVNKLYEKRQEIIDSGSGEKLPTYEDIPHQYGFIAEEVPEEFSTPQRKAVNMYPIITMGIAGTQEVYKKHLALEETVKAQATQLATQEDRIARLEELLLQQLINKKPEQP